MAEVALPMPEALPAACSLSATDFPQRLQAMADLGASSAKLQLTRTPGRYPTVSPLATVPGIDGRVAESAVRITSRASMAVRRSCRTTHQRAGERKRTLGAGDQR
jgi:hypothetical protein